MSKEKDFAIDIENKSTLRILIRLSKIYVFDIVFRDYGNGDPFSFMVLWKKRKVMPGLSDYRKEKSDYIIHKPEQKS